MSKHWEGYWVWLMLLVTMHVHVKADIHWPFTHLSMPVPMVPPAVRVQRYPPFTTVSP
jgi:hypothetical protein